MEFKKIVVSVLLVFVLISLINFFSANQERYTGKATNIKDCYDSDGGISQDVGGTLIGSYTPTKAIKDFCVNSTTLGEYYCDQDKSDGKLKQIYCEDGCEVENGLGRCAEAVKTIIKCEQGCYYNEVCIATGTRIDGRYCDWSGNMKLQKTGECDNNYECESNFCINKDCLTKEQWNNFLKDIEVTHWWE